MSGRRPVVVGFDGSPTSAAALGWALDVAARRGTSVEVVQAWSWNVAGLGVLVPQAPVTVALSAKHGVEEQLATALAARSGPAVPARARTVEGDAATVLVAESATADLLVLGRHGQSAWHRRLAGPVLGGVASACLSRAGCPVAVVPPGAAPRPPLRVVVGIDGSEPSRRALAWAAEHAAACSASLLAVLAWQLTSLPAPASARDAAVPPLSEWEELGRELLETTVADVPGAAGAEQLLLHRSAAAGLLDTVQPEDLLVLGDRGRGGFARLLLGSVSRQCAEHAGCPVVVVRTAAS